jgi:hypothetical protein
MSIRLRRPKLLGVGLPLLALVCAANHYEYHWRLGRLAEKQPDLVVKSASGPGPHINIEIQENAEFLSWSTLGQWQFNPKAPSAPPAVVRSFDGQTVRCAGFMMYPSEDGKAFLLTRSTQVCCYGPRPQFNQFLLAELPAPVKFERLTPVIVTGKFVIDPKPADNYIYRLEGTSAQSADADTVDLDGPAVAKQTGLPLFDFSLMAALEKARQPTPELLALDGKQIALQGAILDRPKDAPLQLILGSMEMLANPLRPPPTFFNAVQVNLAGAKQAPPGWKLQAVFTGTLRISRDPKTWPNQGVVRLDKALLNGGLTAGTKVAYDSGPFIPVYVEVLMFLALLALGISLG